MEKLKTIGDAYMCVGGLPETNRTHPIDVCLMGLAMQAFVDLMRRQRDKFRLPSLELRVGAHTGPVMSGIVGKRKFTYDIWGDAVNVASLLEDKRYARSGQHLRKHPSPGEGAVRD